MKTVINTVDADMIVSNVERPAMDGQNHEALYDLKAKLSARPNILTRRRARWARRASHL